MESMCWEEQETAEAARLKGEETSAPLEGLLTVTPARAGAANVANAR
jgi:hypothetical protein